MRRELRRQRADDCDDDDDGAAAVAAKIAEHFWTEYIDLYELNVAIICLMKIISFKTH